MKTSAAIADLKLLVLTHMYPSRLDEGNGIFIHRHVQALRRAGVDLRVVSPQPWAPRVLWFRENWRQYGQLPRRETWEGSEVLRVPYLQLPLPAYRPWAGVVMARALRPVLRRLRREFAFNVIHSHTITPDGLAALAIGGRHGVPTVNSVRGSDLNEYPHNHPRLMDHTLRVLRGTDRMLCVSRALAGVAEELTGGDVRPGVVYNGVDQQVFRPAEDRLALRREAGLPGDGRLLAFVGRCEKDKGVEELLQAFVGLRKRFADLHLVCLGDGSFRGELLSRAAAAGLDGCLHAPGRVDHGRVAAVVRSADVFVLPSWGEGMPNVLLEAMACGQACVATRVGGIPEVLRDGENGHMVEAKDAAGLEKALDHMFADRAFAEACGAKALETIRAGFSWEANARFHLDLYGKLLQEAGGKG